MTHFLLIATDKDTAEIVYARLTDRGLTWAAGMKVNGQYGDGSGPWTLETATRCTP